MFVPHLEIDRSSRHLDAQHALLCLPKIENQRPVRLRQAKPNRLTTADTLRQRRRHAERDLVAQVEIVAARPVASLRATPDAVPLPRSPGHPAPSTQDIMIYTLMVARLMFPRNTADL